MWLCLHCVFVFLQTLFSGWTISAHVWKTAALPWSSNRATPKLCIGEDKQFPTLRYEKYIYVEISNMAISKSHRWRYEIEKLWSPSSGERCATTTWTNTTMLWETGQRYARRILTMVTLPSMFLCCVYICVCVVSRFAVFVFVCLWHTGQRCVHIILTMVTSLPVFVFVFVFTFVSVFVFVFVFFW